MKQRASELKDIVLDKFDDQKLYDLFCDKVYGEKIELDNWLTELEDTFVE